MATGRSDLVDIDFDRVVHRTAAAVLLEIDGEDVWLPLSAVEIDEDNKTVTMPERLANEKGLI